MIDCPQIHSYPTLLFNAASTVDTYVGVRVNHDWAVKERTTAGQELSAFESEIHSLYKSGDLYQ